MSYQNIIAEKKDSIMSITLNRPDKLNAIDATMLDELARALQDAFVRRGVIPDTGVTYLLPRLVGTPKELELMFTGDMLDAPEAERMGLVNRVVPHDNLMSVAKELAARIAEGPSVAIELMKRAVYQGLETNNFASQLAYEGWAQELCYETKDVEEGVRAFLEKRKPKFSGR